MSNFSDIKQNECIPKMLPDGVVLTNSRTIVLQSVLNKIKEHGRSSMDKEVCGILVGTLYQDKEPYLSIENCIEGKFAEHQIGSVTFTSKTWDYIHEELDTKYPNSKIVGWYHTHPGFGIFLSPMDSFIHENFFHLKWQPAYVFDPQAETDGFFFWNNEQLEKQEVFVIADQPPIFPAQAVPEQKSIRITSLPQTKMPRVICRKSFSSDQFKLLLILLLICTNIITLLYCIYLHHPCIQKATTIIFCSSNNEISPHPKLPPRKLKK